MAFVGFVPWAAVPEFLEAASPAAQVVAGAGAAAEAAAAAAPALILGAGLLGFEIGTQLRKAFNPDETEPFPPPQFPFRGGQTTGRYKVTVEGEATGGYTFSNFATFQGPINGIVSNTKAEDPSTTQYTLYARGISTDFGWEYTTSQITVPLHIVSIEPQGFTDPPIDPEIDYPPAPFDPNVLSPSIPAPFLPGSPEFPGQIVPFQRPGTPVAPSTRPATDPNQEEDPKVIVQVPDLGTQVEFDPAGVTTRGYNPSTSSSPQTQTDPRTTPPKVATPTCDCPCDVSEVLEKIKEVKDEEDDIKKLVTPDQYDSHVAVRLSGSGGSFTLQQYCRAVRLQVTVYPANYDGFSAGSSPDIIYAGWHAFGGQGVFGGLRQQTQYYDNVYLPPQHASTFTYGMKTGYEAIVTEYYDTVKET